MFDYPIVTELKKLLPQLAVTDGSTIKEIQPRLLEILNRPHALFELEDFLESESREDIMKYCLVVYKNFVIQTDIFEDEDFLDDILRYFMKKLARVSNELKPHILGILDAIKPHMYEYFAVMNRIDKLFYLNDLHTASYLLQYSNNNISPLRYQSMFQASLTLNDPPMIANIFTYFSNFPSGRENVEKFIDYMSKAFEFLISAKCEKEFSICCTALIKMISKTENLHKYFTFYQHVYCMLEPEEKITNATMLIAAFDFIAAILSHRDEEHFEQNLGNIMDFVYTKICLLYDPELDYYNQVIECCIPALRSIAEALPFYSVCDKVLQLRTRFVDGNTEIICASLFINTLIDMYPRLVENVIDDLPMFTDIIRIIGNENVRYYLLDLILNIINHSSHIECQSLYDLQGFLFRYIDSTQSELATNCLCMLMKHHPNTFDYTPILSRIKGKKISNITLMMLCSFIAYMKGRAEENYVNLYNFGNYLIHFGQIPDGTKIIETLVRSLGTCMDYKLQEIKDLALYQMGSGNLEIKISGLNLFSALYRRIKERDYISLIFNNVMNDLDERSAVPEELEKNHRLLECELDVIIMILKDNNWIITRENYTTLMGIVLNTLKDLNLKAAELAKYIICDLKLRYKKFYKDVMSKYELMAYLNRVELDMFKMLSTLDDDETDVIYGYFHEIILANHQTKSKQYGETFYGLKHAVSEKLERTANSTSMIPIKVLNLFAFLHKYDRHINYREKVNTLMRYPTSAKKALVLEYSMAYLPPDGDTEPIIDYETLIVFADDLISNGIFYIDSAIKFLFFIATKNNMKCFDITRKITYMKDFAKLECRDSINLALFTMLVNMSPQPPMNDINILLSRIPPINNVKYIPIYYFYVANVDIGAMEASMFLFMSSLLEYLSDDTVRSSIDPITFERFIAKYNTGYLITRENKDQITSLVNLMLENFQ